MDCCKDIKPNDISEPTEKSTEIFSCPMHPEIVSEKPGRCSECGMALVPTKVKKKTAHQMHEPEHDHAAGKGTDLDKHAGHRTFSFLQKFWISVVLTIPILAYSDLPQAFLGWAAPQFAGSEYLSLILGSIVFFYCGSIFITSAYRELKARLPGMMTLIALAIATAYIWSVYSTFFGSPEATLWWELGTLIAVMLLGHWVEMRAVQGAQGALKELAKLLPDTAEVIRNGATSKISLEELKEGDIVLVRPGGKVPADGKVAKGRSDVNESIITGESKPVAKDIGAEVIAGSINGDGSLKIEVTKIGEKTFLAGVMRLVVEAQASKSRLQMLSDRAAFYLTLVAVGAGVITLVAWISVGAGVSVAVTRLVAVLVIACPHALGLAIPLVASISTTMAARNGLLVRERMALESARKIDTVLFDKTGTLTKGEFGVSEIIPAGKNSESRVLLLAAAANKESEHPIGKAIVAKAAAEKIGLAGVGAAAPAAMSVGASAGSFERVPGKGAKGVWNGEKIAVGNDALAEDLGVSFEKMYIAKVAELSRQGKTVVHVMSGRTHVGGIALSDIIRDESREAISSLKKLGVKVAMVTGDSEDVAEWVSRELGIDEFFARVLPDQKSEKVKILQKGGAKVAMVGDGVNDAPALTQADLGIAVGAGTNVAIESAGIILVKNDPRDIAKIVNLSKMTYSKMVQNLFWATGYNLIALPIAAGALYYWGILLEPAVAAVFMSLSTVIVSFNALLLRRRTL